MNDIKEVVEAFIKCEDFMERENLLVKLLGSAFSDLRRIANALEDRDKIEFKDFEIENE